MIAHVGEALARFSRIGALISLLGATHALSLILNWFSINYDNVGRSLITGYTFMEPLMLSLSAGAAAGVVGVLSSNLRDISKIRVVTPLVSFTSAGLALLSPLYTYLVKLPSFQNLNYVPETGLFAALFTGIAIAGASVLALIAGLRTKVTQYIGPQARWGPTGAEESFVEIQEPIAEPSLRTAEESFQRPTEVVEPAAPRREERAPLGETQCLICGDIVSGSDSVECKSCGALFHKDCMSVWIDLGNKCPSCGAELRL
ncbi:MAG: RING finger protein [Nitrososphaerota archaeon]